MEDCKFVLVGDETADNLRLSQILRQVYGRENVARLLELRLLETHLAARSGSPVVVCLDLFSFEPVEATETVGRIREAFPKVVFNLYVDQDEFRRRSHEFPEHWRARFQHYYKTYKEEPDVEFEPIVRGSLRPSILEALHNMSHEPIRLTPVFAKGLVTPDADAKDKPDRPTAFISYSRKDWPGFVSGLVDGLAKESYSVWVDQNLIEGGDDWMDAIGQALQICDTLLLVLSPDAVSSKFVKMEYRYFFRQDKPIIPILYRQVAQIPFELATLHYIDFTGDDPKSSYSRLFGILSRQRNSGKADRQLP